MCSVRAEDTDDAGKADIAYVWLQFAVLGEQYLEAFRDMAASLDRATGKAVFTSIIKLLNPFP